MRREAPTAPCEAARRALRGRNGIKSLSANSLNPVPNIAFTEKPNGIFGAVTNHISGSRCYVEPHESPEVALKNSVAGLVQKLIFLPL
jgi:hypothetical protein